MGKKGPSSLPDRLNRVRGQISAVERMIKDEQEWDKILIQLQAAIAALDKTKIAVVQEATKQKLLSALHDMGKYL